MSDEKNLDKVQKADKVEKPVEKKPGLIDKLKKWLREMRSELKKVVWPTRKQLINNSTIVLVSLVVMAVVIGLFDYVMFFAVELIRNISIVI